MVDDKNDIEKYKKGELTPEQMHALEKRALRDPILQDALEGADQVTGEDFANDVAQLRSKLARSGSGSWFTPLRIAAGVALLVASGAVYLFTSDQNKGNELALETNKEIPSPSSASSGGKDSLQVSDSLKQSQLLALTESKVAGEPSRKKSSKSAKDEPLAVSPELADQNETKPSESTAQPPLVSELLEEEKASQAAVTKAEDLKLDESSTQVLRKEAARATSGAISPSKARVVRGQVKDENGLPLPGVNVVVKGTNLGTITNVNGQYEIETDQDNPSLVFSFVGLQTKEQKMKNRDALDVTMVEDPSQLSEVVVTGTRTGPADDLVGPVIRLAEPFGGRKAYDQYLEKNLKYPAAALEKKIKGRVLIEFTVGIDGTLDDFSVIRSLGYGCDEEVIRLVKEGPKWFPTTEDEVPVESNVRVRMKFDPAKAGQ